MNYTDSYKRNTTVATGIHEVATVSQVENLKMLQTFPEVIWTKLLNNVKKSTDIENLSQSSQFFRDLLANKKVYFLFPRVWKVLEKYLWQVDKKEINQFIKETTNRSWVCCGTPKPFSDTLRLRLVCNTWCKEIDNYLETLPHHFQMHTNTSPRTGCYHWCVNRFRCADNAQKFLNHFKRSHENPKNNKTPFLGRSISISWDWTMVEPEYRQLDPFLLLLETYGEHVWYCRFDFGCRPGNIQYCYLWLKHIISLMPNLKVLQMEYIGLFTFRKQLNNYVNVGDFPKIQKLQYLRLDGFRKDFFYSIISSNAHVTELQICKIGHILDSSSEPLTSFLPKLKRLSLKVDTFDQMEVLKGAKYEFGLEYLALDLEALKGYQWIEIFNWIQINWESTLIELSVILPKQKEGLDFANAPIDLKFTSAKLQRLTLKMKNCIIMDFLLPLKHTLEVLDVDVKCGKELSKNILKENNFALADVRLLIMCGSSIEKSIWALFPKLTLLSLKERYYVNLFTWQLNTTILWLKWG